VVALSIVAVTPVNLNELRAEYIVSVTVGLDDSTGKAVGGL
jgi:hypothetical protein